MLDFSDLKKEKRQFEGLTNEEVASLSRAYYILESKIKQLEKQNAKLINCLEKALVTLEVHHDVIVYESLAPRNIDSNIYEAQQTLIEVKQCKK